MPPPPSSWHLAWDEVAVVVALCALYAVAARRYGTTSWRAVSFGASQLLILAIFVTPIGTLSLQYLLAAHLFQNVALAEWAPALAVLGLSPAMAAAAARLPLVPTLTHPAVALPLWLVSYAAWHIPPVYDAALRNHLLLHAEHASYFVTGLLLWWPVFQDAPRRLSNAAKAIYLFAAFLFASPLGLLLTFLPDPIYSFYVEAPRIWGLDALTDQQIAGVIMATSEAIVFFSVFVVYLMRFLAEEESG